MNTFVSKVKNKFFMPVRKRTPEKFLKEEYIGNWKKKFRNLNKL